MSATSIHNLKLNINSLTSSLSPSCDYYSDADFFEGCERLSNISKFSIFHLNIHGLNANSAKLFQFIAGLNFRFDIIILSEIWAYNIPSYSKLFPSYTFYYYLPVNSMVGAFVCNSLSVNKRDDFNFINNIHDYSAEYLFWIFSKTTLII